MKEPLTFYLTAPEVTESSFKLPNGKVIILRRGDSYLTEDAEEQNFLSQQKYIGAKKLDDKEFRMWATLQFEKIPTVYNNSIQTEKDAEEFLWTSETEEYAINKLKENGYMVYKRNKK
jgi:hypothetical protein